MRFLAPRLVPLGLTIVITQVALFPNLRLLGVVPHLGLVAAVAVAYREGAEPGAWFGFLVGFGYDLFLNTPVGLSALAYALTAYLVGSLERGLLRRGRWLPPFLGFASGIVGGVVFLVVGSLAGVAGLGTVHALGVEVRAALYDALVAPGAFALVSLVLRDHQPAWRLRD
jgi:rod shape-determining protein MreD